MSGIRQESLARQAVYYSCIASVAAFAWFLLGLPAWQSYHTDIAFQTFIAFSAIACIAISLLAFRERPTPFLIMIQATLFYATITHTGFAIENLYNPVSPILNRTTTFLFNDLLELTLISCLLFIAVWSNAHFQNSSRRKLYSITASIGIILLVIFGLIGGLLVYLIPEYLTRSLAVIAFGISVILLGATSYLAFRSANDHSSYQPIVFIVFCVLLLVSSFPLIISVFITSLIWSFGVTLYSVAFFVLYLSLTVPYLQDVGMKPQSATIFASGLSVLFIIPFIVTLLVEGLIPGFYNADLGAYTIIHLGAASLSAVMALLTYGHAKTKELRNLYPLILLFASWTVIDVVQVVMSQLPLPYAGESLVPYITGSIVSLFALYLAISWTMDKPPSNLPRPELWPFIGVAIQAVLVTISEFIQTGLTGAVPFLLDSPLGRSVLLAVNLLAMFEFTYLIVYLSRKLGGGFTIEVLLTGFLSLWILPNILKANFSDWTAGWYSAELLLLVALLFGPGVLAMLYLGEVRKTEIAHQRARVYSDLLVHDVSNYHQAVLISLGLLELEGIHSSFREQVLRDAQIELQRADELIRNVRQIGMSEEIDFQNLEALDLVQCIRNSYESAIPAQHHHNIEFSINRNLGECYVQAHQLIEGIFTNLFRNSIQYSLEIKRIEVELKLDENQEAAVWIARVIDYGQGIEPEKKANLFNRFMIGAKGRGLGLSVAKTLAEVFGGTIKVEDRVPGDYSKGAVFIVSLPAAL